MASTHGIDDTDTHGRPDMDAARTALRAGDWSGAIAGFTKIVDNVPEDDPLAGEAWEGIALAAYWMDDATRAIDAHERALKAYERVGRHGDAARMALWLADDNLSFLGAAAVASGWVERAERLLAETPTVPEWAWLPVYQAHHALQVEHEPARAAQLAETALERARSLNVPDAAVVALAMQGLARVLAGDVGTGIPQLDEASAAAVSRDLQDLNAIAWAFCCLIQACDTVRDFPRAAEWCQRVMAFCERWGLGPIFTSCRTRYASVLTWQGEWQSAESQIEKIMVPRGDAPRPPTAERSALIRLGELRRRQGRYEEAERLFLDAGEHRAAVLGRAAIALARNEADVALDLADRVLRKVPHEVRAERADALLLRILAASRLGAVDRVLDDLAELNDTAQRLGTLPLLAASSHAVGAIAAANGDADAALAAYENALANYDAGGAPHEAAQVRLELANVLHQLGRVSTAGREAARARDELERLGAAGDIERADAFLRRMSVQSEPPSPVGTPRSDRPLAAADAVADSEPVGSTPAADPDAATSRTDAEPRRSTTKLPLSDRELDVLRLVSEGLTNAEIGDRLFISAHTVKRHVANILRKLECGSRAAAVAHATRLGAL